MTFNVYVMYNVYTRALTITDIRKDWNVFVFGC